MSFVLFADSGCNLPYRKLHEMDIHIVSFEYELDGVRSVSPAFPDGFDGHTYYDKLRQGSLAKTTLINTAEYTDAFRPFVEAGNDVMYVSISGGISGTCQSARLAAEDLMAEFPGRTVAIVDSMGAGLGTGILTLRAAQYRNEGMSAAEAKAKLDAEDTPNLCEFFTVDDLMHLKRTGRLFGGIAAIGSKLQVKPILRGDESGHIVISKIIRGRKHAVQELANLYEKRIVDAASQIVAISHGDCLAEAQQLAEKVRAIAEPKELLLCMHEPLTGAHVGPGMLAVFFFGNGR